MELGSYRDLVFVGAGAMGTVFRSRAPDGRDVALKILARRDADSLARFDRERRLLGTFGEADGFVPLLDAGEAPQGRYLVMPYVPGGTLRARLKGAPLGVPETLALGRALAAALGKAHARGIVHRDLKPENVLFTREGRPLVADLGLAKHFDRSASGASQSVSLSREGFRGTAGYMAPEQIADARTAGPPADVFALGAILYECLSGRPALDPAKLFELLSSDARGHVEPLTRVAPGTPPWLVAVIERALAHAPADRFRDGLALEQALARGGSVRRPSLAVSAVALVGIAALAFVLLRPSGPRAADLVGRAQEKRHRGEARGAVEDATRAIELEPGLAEAWATRGAARLDGGDADGALTDAQRAVDLDPRSTLGWLTCGAALDKKGDRKGAIEDATRAIELEPSRATAYSVRGNARFHAGDAKGALDDAKRATELDPKLAVAWSLRGLVHDSQGDYRAAVEEESRAVELEPTRSAAWANRGIAHAKLRDLGAAIADLTRSIELDPKNSLSWSNRAFARLERRELDAAIADATRSIELDGRDGLTFLTRAKAWTGKGERAAAAADYRRFVELAPDDPDAPAAREWLGKHGSE